MTNNVQRNLILEELLDSDDELPMDYNDISTTPAYQIDSRFDMIQFKWINNSKPSSRNIVDSKTDTTASSNIETPLTKVTKNYDEPIINKGVLKKQDLFCLKSIEGFTSDSTLIWFVNFLIYKDLQAGHDFLKSCLVSSIQCDEPQIYNCEPSPRNMNQRYNIIVKL